MNSTSGCLTQEVGDFVALRRSCTRAREPGGVRKLDVELAGVEVRHPGEAEQRDRCANAPTIDTTATPTIDQRDGCSAQPSQPLVAVRRALEPVVERERERDGSGFRVLLARLGVSAVLDFGVGPDAREHRVERERHEQRHEHRERDRHAELEEDLADLPPMNATGKNTATTASVVDSTARPISSVPSFAAL